MNDSVVLLNNLLFSINEVWQAIAILFYLRVVIKIKSWHSHINLYLWWSARGSNPWPPACKADALPAELALHCMVTCTGFKPMNVRVKGVCVKSLHQQALYGGHSKDRTYDQPVNSRLLYRWAMWPYSSLHYNIIQLNYYK